MAVSVRRRVLAVLWCFCILLFVEQVAGADDSALIIASEAGDPIGAGQQLTLAAPEKELRTPVSSWEGTTVNVRTSGAYWNEWTITLRLPWSGLPKRGVYAVSSDNIYGSAVPHFVVQGPKGYFTALDGSFEIKKCTFSETGISSLWFTFDVRSRGSSGSFRGEYRYHADSTEPGVNQPPRAWAWLTETATVDIPAVIEAHLTDDDLPVGGGLTSKWEVLGDGATHSVIVDPSATLTTITFLEPGTYTLRLAISDGEKSTIQDRTIRVPVPVTRNLLHLAGPPGVIHQSQSELLNTEPQWNFWANSPPSNDEFYFFTTINRWLISIDWGGRDRLAPGLYEPTVASGNSQAPGLTFSVGATHSKPGKFEVRPGSHPASDTLFAAAWITFSLYGVEDEPSALGEMRYNIVPATVLGAPPIVDAGRDREFTRTSIRRLHGAAMAVVGASELPVTTSWSVTSGPGEVTFADATALVTDVTFSAPGLYRLRLTAAQGTATASDEVAITVHPGETSLVLRDLGTPFAPDSARYFTAGEYDFRVTEFTGQTLSVACDKRRTGAEWTPEWTADEHWRLMFKAPPGEQLELKRYVDDGFFSSTQATLEVKRGDSFQQFEGEFSIKELNLDEQGKVVSLRVSFASYTMGQDGNRVEAPLIGELRIRADFNLNPANHAPRVSAGLPQYISGRKTTVLSGAFDDDSYPAGSPLVANWQVISGPGTAEISGSNPNASVSFSARGTYVLRYTVSDGEHTVSDDVTIVTGSGAETFQGYVSENQVLYGTFQVRLLASGNFTGSIVVGESRLPLRGKFINGSWSRSTPLRDGSYLTVVLYRSPHDGVINGTFGFSSRVLTLLATQSSSAFLRATHKASPFAAAYTWITEVPEGNQGPHGYSFGTAKVSRDGAVRFAGRLSDGRALSYGGVMGLDGWVPLFWGIPDVEQFAGPVQFFDAPEGFHFRSSAQWIRRPDPKSARFPNGFQFVANLIGARYRSPGSGANLLTRTSEPVMLNAISFAPSWPGGRQDELTLRTNNTFVSASDFTLQADPRTGLFRGTLTDPQRKKRAFQGAILQSAHAGGGHFSTSDEVGAVYLKAE